MYYCVITFLKDFIYLFLERGEGREKERERNITVREKHWSVASLTCPDQGPNLQPSHVPWPRIKRAAFHFAEWRPTNWATVVRELCNNFCLLRICNIVCIIAFGAVNHARSCPEAANICSTFICAIKFILNKGVPSKLKGSVFWPCQNGRWGQHMVLKLFPSLSTFSLRIYLFISRERGREKERGKNINVWLPLARPLLGTWPKACALTGNQTSNPLVRRPALNPLSHTTKGPFHIFTCTSAHPPPPPPQALAFSQGDNITLGVSGSKSECGED